MRQSLRRFFRAAPIRLILWALIALLIVKLGAGLNQLVMHANGGKMPVAEKPSDILFVIGSPRFGVTFFYHEKDYIETHDETHQVMRADMKYLILADRIPMRISLDHNFTPPLLFDVFDYMQLPVNQDGIASIGDLFIWAGGFSLMISFVVCMFLLLQLIVRFLRRIISRH